MKPDQNRREDDLEQLRVALEDARDEAAVLAADRDALAAGLAHRTLQLRETQALLAQRERAAAAAAARVRVTQFDFAAALAVNDEAAAAEELRVTMEELQALAEELEATNQLLARTNRELAERVTELTRLNTLLHDSEERLRFAHRVAGAGTWDWDIGAGHTRWSAECFGLFGLDPTSVAPSCDAWFAAIDPDDRAAADATLRDCLRHRNPDFQVEFRVPHPGREQRWLAARGRLVCNAEGDPERLVGLFIDITDRKRAELLTTDINARLREEVAREVKAREEAQAALFQTMKLEALGQLTGGVAHDFNNLLAVITSGADMLRRVSTPERRDRLLDAMSQAAQRGADLTRRLLTFARRQALRPAPLDVAAWLHDIQELLARSLRGDIVVEVAGEPALWPALVDAAELELAVLNLAVNARDAMPKGGTLRLSARAAELQADHNPDGLSGDFVALEVRDTGEGMVPEVLARAFEPFFSTKEVGRGTGLGLAQVYGFARQSGGTVYVASTPGQGTVVTLLLPRAAEQAAIMPVPGGAAAVDDESDALHGLRLLLIEDDDDVARVTTEVLRHLGHEVSRVSSGRAAHKALAEGLEIDLVLSDVVMPGGLDGLGLAQELAAHRPDLPVLLYSGYGGAPARVAAAGLPLLRKPFTLGEMRRALANTLDGHRDRTACQVSLAEAARTH